MKDHKVPVQSLIDHIKTAIDVDDWAKEMAEELLKEQETTFEKDGHHVRCLNCGECWCDSDREGDQFPMNFCPNCGRLVKWE